MAETLTDSEKTFCREMAEPRCGLCKGDGVLRDYQFMFAPTAPFTFESGIFTFSGSDPSVYQQVTTYPVKHIALSTRAEHCYLVAEYPCNCVTARCGEGL